MNLTLIVNPVAGRGRARKAYPSVARCLDKLKLDHTAVFTEGPGHATELANAASRGGSDVVVACGGDGTAHEVINGLDGHPTTVGLIPCGTGNDLAINLGIPNDPERACRTLAHGEARRFDLARTDRGCYACVAGAGFDSMVNRAANEGARLLRGTSVYVYALFKTLVAFKPMEMSVEADGESWTGRAMFVVAANAASYGGGMRIAPAARMDDGLLDIVIVREISKLELARVFPKVFSGTHITHPAVKQMRARRVRLSSPERLDLYGDGEYIQELPANIEAHPGALSVILPAPPPKQ